MQNNVHDVYALISIFVCLICATRSLKVNNNDSNGLSREKRFFPRKFINSASMHRRCNSGDAFKLAIVHL